VPKLLITFFGLGLVPVAPGTFGSFGAAAIWCGLWFGLAAKNGSRGALDVVTVVLIILVSAGTVAWGPWAQKAFGREDPGQCVSDEAAGQWLALLFLPACSVGQMPVLVGAQFLFFRLFDIVKPPPARRLEALPAGWGILLDDLAAGLYANLLGQILFRLIWPVGQ